MTTLSETPNVISGCTSPASGRSPTARCRSSPAARAATSTTSTASATSTACRGCSPCRSGTAARSSPTRPRHQSETLAYFPVWSFAHEPAITLATRLADYAPGDLNRVFFTPTGGDAVETAIKLSRQYWKLRGQHSRTKVISRYLAYHGTSIGALSLTGVPSIKTPFEPLMPGAIKVQTPYRYRCNDCMNQSARARCGAPTTSPCASRWRARTRVAAVFMEPVQNTGGAFTPPEGYWQRVREICDEYDVLLVSDEVISAFGRFGHMFGSLRYGYQPDMITFAKGVTSGYSPLGGVMISDRIAEPFLDEHDSVPAGPDVRRPPGVAARSPTPTSTSSSARTSAATCCANEGRFKRSSTACATSRSSATCAATATSSRSSSSPTRRPAAASPTPRPTGCCAATCRRACTTPGSICRADDRGEPVITLSPPLIAGEEEFAFIEAHPAHARSPTPAASSPRGRAGERRSSSTTRIGRSSSCCRPTDGCRSRRWPPRWGSPRARSASGCNGSPTRV